MTDTQPTVTVVGGGLAGLAAAVRLADDGWRVTVLEARPRLGGATYSFHRSSGGADLIVDNGQHVFLRCCTEYRDFLGRLGVTEHTDMQSRLDVPVVDPRTGQRARLRRDRLPAPLHLSRALLGYRLLSPTQRVRAIWAALALDRVDRDAASSDEQTFAEWLKAHGQSDAAITRLFDVFTIATLNTPASQVSLALAAMVFQDGLLRKAAACDIGLANVPLGHLHGDPAAAILTDLGATIRLHTKARRLAQLPHGRWQVTTDTEELESDAVVLAVPHDVAAELLPDSINNHELPGRLDVAPIINIHVVYDRAVLSEPFLAAVESPVQFVFDRTRQAGLEHGQYVAISVSAADEYVDMSVADLRAVFEPEIARVLPLAAKAEVLDFFVTREREATFRAVPGSAASRLPTETGTAGLVIAGAWSKTGWPATMEGAVRSGNAAARALETARSGAGPLRESHPRRLLDAGRLRDRQSSNSRGRSADNATAPDNDGHEATRSQEASR